MQAIPIRDPATNIRMFDLTLDNDGKVFIELKIGKIKLTTPLAAVLSQAEELHSQ